MAQKAPTEPIAHGTAPEPPRMTFEEFLAWDAEGTRAEWVDGEVRLMSSVTDHHDDLRGLLQSTLRLFVEERDLGVVRGEPFVMRPRPDLPGRSPDVLFIAKANLGRLQPTHLEGPADVAVEIVSRDSRRRDRVDKLGEYEAGGVREYWVIDQPRQEALFYRLGEDGTYQKVPLQGRRVFRSEAIPGFWLRLEWLWQDPLPRVRALLIELGVA